MASSDDDDAPEELTLVQGRDDAELARKQQRENERRLASEEKTRRRMRNELNREAKLKRQQERKDKAEEAEDKQTEESRLASKASGFLDESIVQYLVAKERDQIPTSVAPESRTTTKRKRKKTSLSEGRIKVLAQDNFSTSRKSTGMDFLKRRLYGSHVVRSKVMIARPQAG